MRRILLGEFCPQIDADFILGAWLIEGCSPKAPLGYFSYTANRGGVRRGRGLFLFLGLCAAFGSFYYFLQSGDPFPLFEEGLVAGGVDPPSGLGC